MARFWILLLLTLLAPSAWADLVLVVGRDSPIASLSREQAERFYLGRGTAFPDGTPVGLLDLPPGNLRDQFYLRLTGKNPIQIRAYWSRQVFTGRARPPREVGSPAELRALLVQNPNLLGYLADGDADATVKVLLRLE
ncbi:MAG: hypothetical protein RBS40_06145 [Rhodocyclaceae bacterium]|nr:hypothetical protein [Rhodocyclaceae bacterium]